MDVINWCLRTLTPRPRTGQAKRAHVKRLATRGDIQGLCNALRDEDVVCEAAEALEGLHDPRIQPSLVDSLLRWCGDYAATWEGDKSARFCERVSRSLQSSQWQPRTNREQAAFLVAKGEYDLAAGLGAVSSPFLVAGLGVSSFEAASALKKLGDPAIAEIVAAFERRRLPWNSYGEVCRQFMDQRLAALALEHLEGGRERKEVGIRGIRTTEVHVGQRCQAAQVLAQIGGPEAEVPLARALVDSEECVARAAAEALSSLSPASVVLLLVEYLEDADRIERSRSHSGEEAQIRHDSQTLVSIQVAHPQRYWAWVHAALIRDALLAVTKNNLSALPAEWLRRLAGMRLESGVEQLGIPDFETEPDVRRWGVDVSAIVELARREFESRKGV